MKVLAPPPLDAFFAAFLTPPAKSAYREIWKRTDKGVLNHFALFPDHFKEFEKDKRGFAQFRNYLFRQNAKIVFEATRFAKIRTPNGSFMTELHGTHIVHYKHMKSLEVPLWLPKALQDAMFREVAENESYQPPLTGLEAHVQTPVEQLTPVGCGLLSGMDGRIAMMCFLEQVGQTINSRYELELSDDPMPLVDDDVQSNSKTDFKFRGGNNDDGQADSG